MNKPNYSTKNYQEDKSPLMKKVSSNTTNINNSELNLMKPLIS